MELSLLPDVLLLVNVGGGELHHLGDLVRADADGVLCKVHSLQVDLLASLAQEQLTITAASSRVNFI